MAMLVSASSVTAAEPRNYPIRPITFVVPSVAGNVNDAVARLIGQELTKTWGQAVVVENRPGAGTTTGTKYVAKSPDSPYKTIAQLVAAGHIKIGMIAVGTAMPLLQAGKIIPLAITGEKRSELLPKVPTFLESGYKGFEPDTWMGLLFPAGTPKEYSEVLSREIGRIVRLPEITTRLHGLVLEPVGNSPDEFARILKNDMDKWSQLIQQLGIKME